MGQKIHLRSNFIPADMIKSVRSARVIHEQFQLKSSEEKKASQKHLKRKIVTNVLNQVNRKKICLQDSFYELVKDSHKLSLNAEKGIICGY